MPSDASNGRRHGAPRAALPRPHRPDRHLHGPRHRRALREGADAARARGGRLHLAAIRAAGAGRAARARRSASRPSSTFPPAARTSSASMRRCRARRSATARTRSISSCPIGSPARRSRRCRRDGRRQCARSIDEGPLLKVILETGELAEPGADRDGEPARDRGRRRFHQDLDRQDAGLRDPRGGRDHARRDQGVRPRPVGLKPSGGIRTLSDAALYLDLADRVMGPGWATPRTFRIGASSVYDALIAAIEGRAGTAADGAY